MAAKLEIGDKIPEFILKDQNAIDFNSSKDTIGKTSIIYFYPKDNSGICTAEACAFRDVYQVFSDSGIQVIGINSASVESHKEFALKNRLPYKLLSDTGNAVIKKFGVKNALFLTGRETFIVNGEGTIIYKFRDFFKGTAHVEQAVSFLKLRTI